ncbi:helix-turn-helix transcriptional regulator [Cytobacillus purgationiresistens]|uniref:Tetratricopeptide (TPR) repeat protein n=1 Tax=Cytobacillus purgationiresistens TaxID=863449 RepID=A0ABU0ASL8_9BACI|nr:helix-turn-helix transcriptional regulator [Cytobacillus purgationiresistens]MDQ0273786.1 tetratricopeptide (TPR) repeat protein [Cytobacillus purgationiresistens]
MIGSRIKYYRINSNLTQEELCKGVCSPSYLSKVENNNMDPSEEILKLLCKKMNICVSLLRNVDENELDKKIGYWYELLKSNTEKSLLNENFNEMNKLFNSLQDTYPVLKFKIFNIKYFIKIENYKALDSNLKDLKKYQSTMSDDLFFYFCYLSGVSLYVQKRFCQAEELLLLSLRKIQNVIRHSDTFDYELGDIFYYLSLCNGKLHKTHKTKEFALKSLEIADHTLDYLQQIKLYVILGINEGRTKNYEKAIEYYQRAIKIATSINQDSDSYTQIIHHNLGYLYSLQGKHQEAITYFQNSLKNSSNRINRLITTYFCLAREYKSTKQINKMKEMIKKGRGLITDNGEYTHHFNMLEFLIYDCLIQNKQYIKEKVLTFFIDHNQWNYVMEYSEMLAISLEANFQYKEAAKLYRIAFSAQKKLL